VRQCWHKVTILIAAYIFPIVVAEVSSHALATLIQQGFRILDHYGRDREPARQCKMALAVLRERHTRASEPDVRSNAVGMAVPSGIWPHPSHSDDSLDDLAWISTNPSDFLAEAGMEPWLFSGGVNQDMGNWL